MSLAPNCCDKCGKRTEPMSTVHGTKDFGPGVGLRTTHMGYPDMKTMSPKRSDLCWECYKGTGRTA